jgi:hypothetical protein
MIDLRRDWAGPPRPRVSLTHTLFVSAVFAAIAASLIACSTTTAPAGNVSTSGSGISQIGTSPTTGSGVSPGIRPSTPGRGPGTTTGSAVAVDGTVVSSPGCPGPVLAESPCPDRPVAGARVELRRGSTIVATTRTDGGGRFELRVPPGEYTVTAFNVGLASQASQPISVTGPVHVALVVDSGLR